MTQVKICGVTEPDHALAAAEAGANFVGLVFYPQSHRLLTPEKAREIVAVLREKGKAPLPATVGVFVNLPPAQINELARFCSLDWVQLSGDEPWEDFRRIERPIIKALRVKEGQSAEELAQLMEEGSRFFNPLGGTFLLDSQVPGRYGGTGERFNWDVARSLAPHHPFLLAGGLSPENVTQVLREVRPLGVDVSSGVETDGVKDVAKIKAFLQAVRDYERL